MGFSPNLDRTLDIPFFYTYPQGSEKGRPGSSCRLQVNPDGAVVGFRPLVVLCRVPSSVAHFLELLLDLRDNRILIRLVAWHGPRLGQSQSGHIEVSQHLVAVRQPVASGSQDVFLKTTALNTNT